MLGDKAVLSVKRDESGRGVDRCRPVIPSGTSLCHDETGKDFAKTVATKMKHAKMPFYAEAYKRAPTM